MKCPKCEADTRVVDSRPREDGSIFRRRECLECRFRFSSLETVWIKKTSKQLELEKLIAALAKHLIEESSVPTKRNPRRVVVPEVAPPTDELAKLIEEQAKDGERVWSNSLDKPDIFGRSQYDLREGYGE